jgi:ribosomal protein L30/L7E
MKNIRSLLGEVHRYTGLFGLTSDDISMVFVFFDSARVELHRKGIAKLVRKLKLDRMSTHVTVVENHGRDGYHIKIDAKGIDWYYTSDKNDRLEVLDELWPPRPQPRKQRTNHRRTWKSYFDDDDKQEAAKPSSSTAVPRDLLEARAFVRSIYRPTLADDVELLRLAKRGQVAYHPDRPGGDPLLSRAFNAAASLLKGAL